MFVTGLFYNLWQKEKAERKEQFENVTTLINGLKYSLDSSRVETGIMMLSVGELNKLYPDLKNELKQQGISIKNIQQYQHSILGIDARFEAIINRINDTTQISEFKNRWIRYYEKRNDNDTGSFVQLQMDIDLKQAIEKVKKPYYWNPFKGNFLQKELKQKIWTDNPYAILKYNDIIQVE
jgi:hypothetical protein